MLKVKLLTIVVSLSTLVTVMALRDSHTAPWCGPDVISGPFSNVTWKEFTCGPNEFVTSITAHGHEYVEGIRVRCSKIGNSPPFLSVFEEGANLGVVHRGVRGDSTYAHMSCPSGEAVTSLSTHCGSYVDRIAAVVCKEYLPHNGAFRDTSTGPVRSRRSTKRFLNIGGLGGNLKSLGCPTGEAVYKVKVAYGEWIDLLEVFCKKPPRRRPGPSQFRPPTARDFERFKQR